MANRFNNIISFYVQPEQTGFIPHTSMIDNIWKKLNMVEIGMVEIENFPLHYWPLISKRPLT